MQSIPKTLLNDLQKILKFNWIYGNQRAEMFSQTNSKEFLVDWLNIWNWCQICTCWKWPWIGDRFDFNLNFNFMTYSKIWYFNFKLPPWVAQLDYWCILKVNRYSFHFKKIKNLSDFILLLSRKTSETTNLNFCLD